MISSEGVTMEDSKVKAVLQWPTTIKELQCFLAFAPILHHPDPDKPFIVEVNASNTSIGAILSQFHGTPPNLFPCTYFSHKLCTTE